MLNAGHRHPWSDVNRFAAACLDLQVNQDNPHDRRESRARHAVAAADAIPRHYNFAADLLGRNRGRAGKPAYIDVRGTWTYGELADRVGRFARVLRAHGVLPEQRILICLTDTIDWPTAFLGAIKTGVIAVPVNTLLTETEYRFMLTDSRARLLVVSAELYPRFAPLIGACPDLAHVVVSGAEGCGHARLDDLLASAAGPDVTAATTRDDLCFWLYTSGSTGEPKGVVHAHASPRLTADLYGKGVLGLTEHDLVYSVAKLFFAYGLGNALSFPLAAGATTVLLPDRPTRRRSARFYANTPSRCCSPCRPSMPRCSRARRRRYPPN